MSHALFVEDRQGHLHAEAHVRVRRRQDLLERLLAGQGQRSVAWRSRASSDTQFFLKPVTFRKN